MNCKICHSILNEQGVCATCGYDLGSDHELYPTLYPVAPERSMHARRAAWVKQSGTMGEWLRCPDCSATAFSVHLKEGDIVCGHCGRRMNLGGILQQVAAYRMQAQKVPGLTPQELLLETLETANDEAEALDWHFDEALGLLTVEGHGLMPDYLPRLAPWYRHHSDIGALQLEPGITRIGSCAFEYCSRLGQVTVPTGVTAIGAGAFYCTGLTEVRLPSGLRSIGQCAFHSVGRLRDVYFAGSRAEWEGIQIDDFNEDLLRAAIHFDSP